jgi:hypothetical protein
MPSSSSFCLVLRLNHYPKPYTNISNFSLINLGSKVMIY